MSSAYLRTICDGLYSMPEFIGDFAACGEQGEAASDQAYPRTANPYHTGTGEYDSWDYGWTKSLTELCGPQ